MTTLVGIASEKDKKAVTLGSDVSMTHTLWQTQGDIAYKVQRKTETQKIWVNDDKTAALCMTGIYDNLYKDFLANFLSGKFDMKKIADGGFFPELLNVNLKRWNGKMPSGDLNSLLMVTRFGDPRLYTCWPMGLVEERNYTSIGSGSDFALHYLNSQDKIIPGRISLPENIDLNVNALGKSSQDIYTGGLDLLAFTKKDVYPLGERISKKMNEAKTSEVEEIKKLAEDF